MHTHTEDKYRKKKAKEETNGWERQADRQIDKWKQKEKDANTEMLKKMLFISTKHNMQIFGVIPFIKQQNST